MQTAASTASPTTAATAHAEERGWVLEIGPAAEWSLRGDTPNYGANIAIEREVIEGWLEIEIGMSGLWVVPLLGDALFQYELRTRGHLPSVGK